MNALLILIPVSLIFLIIAIGFFIYAVRSGQFDDMDTPALDILTEQKAKHKKNTVDAMPPTDAD